MQIKELDVRKQSMQLTQKNDAFVKDCHALHTLSAKESIIQSDRSEMRVDVCLQTLWLQYPCQDSSNINGKT